MDNYPLISVISAKRTESGIVYTGPCIFTGILLGMDGLWDPTITVYDSLSASGNEIMPTCTFDSSAMGMNGATGMFQYCSNGIYVEITCTGTVEVKIMYSPFYKWEPPH